MDDYISREIVLRRFEDIKHAAPRLSDKVFLDGVMAVIDNIEAADVAPVIHGRWQEIRDPYGKTEGWLCECGRETKCKDNYCPSCGAKMDKEGA